MSPGAEVSASGRNGAFVALLLIILASAALRIGTALGDPNFDRESDIGMLKSDPGLIYALTRQVLAANGAVPASWGVERSIEYPAGVDVWATFTVGQEFLVAWTYNLLGAGVPLHVFCVWLMGLVASLTALGVYGLTSELTRANRYTRRWALAATLLWAVLPASYRTIGFILIREDLALPCFALHLWLVARAVRKPGRMAWGLAAFAAGAALATWHAMSFVFTLELLCLSAWFLRSGVNPLRSQGAITVPVILALCALLVPALASRFTIAALPFALLFGLTAAALGRRSAAPDRVPGRRREITLAVMTLAGMLAVSSALTRFTGAGEGDFGHVFELVLAKLRHAGRLPADPSTLSFDARLLWQGPFATLSLWRGFDVLGLGLGLALPGLVLGARAWFAGDEKQTSAAVLASFALAALFASWLAMRFMIVPAVLLPPLAALGLAHLSARAQPVASTRRRARRRLVLAVAALALASPQVVVLVRTLRTPLAWYRPPERQASLEKLVAAVEREVPEGAAITADFMSSTAILAHTGRPIVLQPKWERALSRQRIEDFWKVFYAAAPSELARLLLDEWDCRYLALDPFVLRTLEASRIVAGERPGSALRAGSAAQLFFERRGVPAGFELLWAETLDQTSGMRLYRVLE